jgi:hypothetical protein
MNVNGKNLPMRARGKPEQKFDAACGTILE